MVKWIFVVLCSIACGDNESLPTCAELGCIYAPSGSPVAWEPCSADAATCWCLAPAKECER